MSELKVVGKRVPHWAASEKAKGTAKFTVDIMLPGMLTGRILTSPHAHARIKRIDTSKAKALPGVEAVITFADVPQKLYNPNKLDLILYHPEGELKDMYVLSEKARFVGDRIAAVAAIDDETAEKALRLIEVEYEVLPAVFDPLEAMKPGAPAVHEFAPTNVPFHLDFPVRWGDVNKGFQEADVVVEETFKTSRQHIAQLEPCASVASFDADGKLTVWSPSQHAFLHRRKLGELFDIPEGMIRWITPHVGGGFGKYGSFGVEPVCVALARKSGRPVKIEYGREEDLFGTETRQTYIAKVRIGVKKDGSITALEQNLIVDGGAYFTHNCSTAIVNMGGFLGLYRCPNVAAAADFVYTNVQVAGGVRGYGSSEGQCVLEQMVDKAAGAIGMDPMEVRIKNLKKAGDPGCTGLPMETCTLEECIKVGLEKTGWKEKRARAGKNGAKRYGIGMGIMMDVTGAQPFDTQHRNAQIKLNEDGSANLIISASDLGQNLQGAMAQIAAEVLGLRYEDIHIVTGDTDVTLFDTGQHASGSCYQIGNAVIRAAELTRQQLLERAAKKLGVAAGDLIVENRNITVHSDPSKKIPVAQIAKEAIYNFEGAHQHISGTGSFSPTENPPPFAAVFAEVEVDTETGEVKILKITDITDVGRAINPTTVEGQVEGGIAQSVGYCLTEEYVVNGMTGALESDNFNTYRLPSTLDMPETEVILYHAPVPSGPFGAKGVGQSAMIAVTPAILNAIYDAVGVFVTEVPATPERILKALKAGSRK